MFYDEHSITALNAIAALYTWNEGLRWTISFQRTFQHRWVNGRIFNPLPWNETQVRMRMTASAFEYLAARYRLDRETACNNSIEDPFNIY